MSDVWVDPRENNPWLRGEPTQGELQANEFGMGEFTFDPDALEQREDLHDLLLDYLKVRGIYLEDIIPNLPQEVEAPDPEWTPYTSDILDTYRNDEAYNKVAQLVDSGLGYEDALLAVEQEAMEKGWGMPMLNSDNRQVQFYNGQPQPSMTEGELKAQQAAQQANEAAGKLTGDPTKDAWTVLLDSGAIRQGADGSFVAAPRSNFDMDEFDSNAQEFMTERSEEQRSQDERDAALAEYADYVKPRYLIDVDSMERDGIQGAKSDYAVEWEDDAPKKQSMEGRGQQPATAASAAPPSASLPMLPGGPSLNGFADPIMAYERELRAAGADERRSAMPAAGATSGLFGLGRRGQGPNSDLPGFSGGSQTSAEWRRAGSQARQRLNNQRVNETNKADREIMNAGYQRRLQEYKQDNAVASKKQQRLAMMDEFMASYYRGGA